MLAESLQFFTHNCEDAHVSETSQNPEIRDMNQIQKVEYV